MTPLGMEAGADDRRDRASSRKSKGQQSPVDRDSEEKQTGDDNSDSRKSKGRGGVGDSLRGLFGF
jgi:hypothetical protein